MYSPTALRPEHHPERLPSCDLACPTPGASPLKTLEYVLAASVGFSSMVSVDCSTTLQILSTGTKSPCFAGQLKYLWLPMLPSFLPTGPSRCTPTQQPALFQISPKYLTSPHCSDLPMPSTSRSCTRGFGGARA